MAVKRPHLLSLFIKDSTARLFRRVLLFNLALVEFGLSVHVDAPSTRHEHIVHKNTAIDIFFLGVRVHNWRLVKSVIVIPVRTQNIDDGSEAIIVRKPFCK